jgi:mono/diheme cytochrome c family protein
MSKRLSAASMITVAMLLAFTASAQSAESPAPPVATAPVADDRAPEAISTPGQLLVERRCARCHATGQTGVSPYPGAQPFRNFGQRWTREKLAQALHTGILAEHDASGVRFEMRLNDQEIADFFNYLDSIATPDHPAPRGS